MTQTAIRLPANGWRPRPYQRPLWSYLEHGGREAVAIWHRRAGKDEIAMQRTCVAAHERIAGYLHMLPEAEQARKALWNSVNAHTGKRRIDEVFPLEIRETTRENEMFIKLKCGSTWQLVGSDNYNSLMGSGHAGVVYSEWARANPQARAFLRPILAENKGWELFITTPRGRNHALKTLEAARSTPGSFAQVLTVADTNALSAEVLERERRGYILEFGEDEGQVFYDQEYMCSFVASVLGSILGKYIERAEREGRISDAVEFDPSGSPVEISSDIGRRDPCAWWFWQPKLGGFSLVDYADGSGLNAEEWCAILDKKLEPYKLGKIWLPHDAKAKTFAARHSALDQFLTYFGEARVGIVPDSQRSDRINAARTIMPRCEFNASRCADGLDGLRAWMYVWNDELKEFSKEPRHDWASHPGDGFSYGAQVMRERQPEVPKKTAYQKRCEAVARATRTLTFDEAIKLQDRRDGIGRRQRI